MAIDKITPNRLDRSSDFKLIPKTSMVDALNMIVTEDSANTTGDNIGDLGVLKNVKGNSYTFLYGMMPLMSMAYGLMTQEVNYLVEGHTLTLLEKYINLVYITFLNMVL